VRIYVIRHSIRETPDDFSEAEEGDPDAELTPEGQDIADALGKWMADNDEIPTRIVASPTVRTSQTAERMAKAIAAEGFVAPDVESDVGIGPFQSIRALVLKLGADGAKRVAIVSHRGSIVNGLKALAVDNDADANVDNPAMGELRSYDVKRKSGRWSERARVRPGDLGFSEHY
jgi:phosphohistidine phosphatase SixA